ncbi:response regulator [Vibrio echinoideorum]|uniref:histidine kinase n=1 Tax=Vibrio echinoideorum TaxID=2100116 RepID=A0ABU9FVY0_9VIBR
MLDIQNETSHFQDNRSFIKVLLASISTFILLVVASTFAYNKYSEAFESISIYENINELVFAIDNTRINAIAYTRNGREDQKQKVNIHLDRGIELASRMMEYNEINDLLIEYKKRFNIFTKQLETKSSLEQNLTLISGELKGYFSQMRSYQLSLINNSVANNSYVVAKTSLESLDQIYSLSEGKNIDTKELIFNLSSIAEIMNLSTSNLERMVEESFIGKSTVSLSKKQEIQREENLESLHGYVIDNAKDNLDNTLDTFNFNMSAEEQIQKFAFQYAKIDNFVSKLVGESNIEKGIKLTDIAIEESTQLLEITKVIKSEARRKKGLEFMNKLDDTLIAYINNLEDIYDINQEIKSNAKSAINSILLASTIAQEREKEKISEISEMRGQAYQVWLLLALFIILIMIKFYLVLQVMYGFFSLSKDAQLAKEKAITANLVKSKFLANMSHEIRTPMNAVIGMLDLTLSSDLGVQDRNRLLRAKQASNSLMHIINDILDISKIEAGQLKIERANYALNRVLAEVYEIMLVSAEKKGIILEYNYNCNESNVYLNGDQLRLRQVLFNIIGNAIKFTDIGKVILDVKTTQITPKLTKLKISIEDTGIGISEQNQKHLFEAFKQVDDSTTRVYGGTGLGLAITKELVNLMGGSLVVNSQEGIGSTFTFEIQAETASAIDTEDTQIEAITNLSDIEGSLNGMRILLVEDNEINQELMIDLLGQYCELDVCGNGLDAIRLLKSNEYDGVLMDCQMPKMDGYRATEHVRTVLALDVPIIALTASVMQEDRQKAFDVGMQDYIFKPVNFDILMSSIANHFNAKNDVTDSIELIKTSPSETLSIKALQTLDVINGMEISRNSRKLYITLLNKFMNKYGKSELNSWTNRALEVHTLKGVSSNLGAKRLFQLCETYETNEVEDDFVALKAELSSVISYVNNLIDDVNLLTESYGKGKKTAVIVDDDEIAQLVLNNSLDGIDIYSITTSNSYYALDLVYLCSKELTFVFTDLCMPILNGFEVRDEIKELGLSNQVKVIACSGGNNYTDDEVSDFYKFIQKPYDLVKLKKLLF